MKNSRLNKSVMETQNDKFQNKYTISSHRMPGWNYAGTGYYFITIMTHHRVCYLGDIKNEKMIPNDFGKIVKTEWYRSFKMRVELILDEWIMMPNHIHAIVIVQNDIHDIHVETHGRASLLQSQSQSQSTTTESFNTSHIPHRLPKSLSSFMAGFKSAVNSKIDDHIDKYCLNIPKFNKHNHFFQPNYHDRVIRNELEYNRIKKYIQNNPLKWDNVLF